MYLAYSTWDTPKDAREFAVATADYDKALANGRTYTITTESRPNDVLWIAGLEQEHANRLAEKLFRANPAGH